MVAAAGIEFLPPCFPFCWFFRDFLPAIIRLAISGVERAEVCSHLSVSHQHFPGFAPFERLNPAAFCQTEADADDGIDVLGKPPGTAGLCDNLDEPVGAAEVDAVIGAEFISIIGWFWFHNHVWIRLFVLFLMKPNDNTQAKRLQTAVNLSFTQLVS